MRRQKRDVHPPGERPSTRGWVSARRAVNESAEASGLRACRGSHFVSNPNPQSLGSGLPLPYRPRLGELIALQIASRPFWDPLTRLWSASESSWNSFSASFSLRSLFFRKKKRKNHFLVLISSKFAAKHNKTHSSGYQKTLKSLGKTMFFQ